jgi:hypothetical protein
MRGADGDQPFRSVTIGTSAAADPRRSRTSLVVSMPPSKHPMLMVLIKVLVGFLLLWVAGLAACFAFMGISGVGPGGGSWPPSVQDLTIGVPALFICLAALAGVGFCFGLIGKRNQEK